MTKPDSSDTDSEDDILRPIRSSSENREGESKPPMIPKAYFVKHDPTRNSVYLLGNIEVELIPQIERVLADNGVLANQWKLFLVPSIGFGEPAAREVIPFTSEEGAEIMLHVAKATDLDLFNFKATGRQLHETSYDHRMLLEAVVSILPTDQRNYGNSEATFYSTTNDISAQYKASLECKTPEPKEPRIENIIPTPKSVSKRYVPRPRRALFHPHTESDFN